MDRDVMRVLREGLGFGLIAGIVLALASMIAAAASGEPAIVPVQLVASVVADGDAMHEVSAGVLATGVIVHLVLAAIFGAIYGLFDGALSADVRHSYAWQSGLGLLFGTALWLVDIEIVARVVYPWFLEQNQLASYALHAVFFGLPLGLMIAASERSVTPTPREAHAA
jgi:hypothetical protein